MRLPGALDETLWQVYHGCDPIESRRPGSAAVSCPHPCLNGRIFKDAIDQWQFLSGEFPEMAELAREPRGSSSTSSSNATEAASSDSEESQELDQPVFTCDNFRYYSGNVLFKQGKTSEAEQQYRQALELNPCLAKAQNALGVVLAQPGTDGRGRTGIPPCPESRLEPSSRPATIWPRLFEKQGPRVAKALKEYQQSLATDPANLETY